MDYRELNRLAKDPAKARSAAQFLLTMTGFERTDWELDFLEAMSKRDEGLTTRQAESLLGIRNNSIRYTKVSGYKLIDLGLLCWRLRGDLQDNEDREFIEAWYSSGKAPMTRGEAGRLRRCLVELGEVETHVYWNFPVPAVLAI